MENVPANPKLSYMDCEFDTHFKVFHELMSNKVLEILLIASAYDAYILEEEGALASKIINEYRGLNLSRPPRLTRVDAAQKALHLLADKDFDLVITMPNIDDMDSFELGATIKQMHPDLPVILLAHSAQGLYPLPSNKDCSGIDQIFIWLGDADLLLAIVKSVEDRLNVQSDTERAQVRVIILVEDSPLYRSYFLPLIYREVVRQIQEVLEESLNEEHRLLKMRARPKILVAENFEAALELYERYHPYLFTIMTDTRFPRGGKLSADAGFQLLVKVKKRIPDLPALLLSTESHNRKKAQKIGARFLDKNSSQLSAELHTYFLDDLGFGDMVFRLADGKEVGRASNLRQLEAVLQTIPVEPLQYHAQRNRFSNWIMARSEIVLASRLRQVQVSDFTDVEFMRQYLIDSIHRLRKWRQKGVVAQFNAKTFDPEILDFVKIGSGSLGGKARGMAFVANLLRQSPGMLKKYPKIKILTPPTLVITTDGFDTFISANQLRSKIEKGYSDQQITTLFLNAEMPDPVVRDLRAYLKSVRCPLAVRSSSLLEDAQHQPYTGLFRTVMIPNNHMDDAVRLDQLLAAVKMVYASTWFEKPRCFADNTALGHRQEQMAVMIQQVVGQTHGNYFYPAISGVARSQNYYPIGQIKPDDGMARIALGMGKTVIVNKGGLRFCPKYPAMIPDFSKPEDILANTQTLFFALPLKQKASEAASTSGNGLVERQVADALHETPVQKLVSTYFPQDHRIRDAFLNAGAKVLTFASVLKHNAFPLADVLTDVLEMGRRGMGCHIELEFAVNLGIDPNQPSEFCILQMRPMPAGDDLFEVEIHSQERDRALCFSTQALGHGKRNQIADIIYVKPDRFDPSQTMTIARQIAQFNAMLKSQNKSYLLVGPGRWGSFDRWLGIPVKWEDINGAGTVIELRNASLKADPSQGSHFFQHITTQGLFYLTITEDGPDIICWDRILKLKTVQETSFVRHVKLPRPMLVKCDGRCSQGIVLEAA